jgi:hypothetical protein
MDSMGVMRMDDTMKPHQPCGRWFLGDLISIYHDEHGAANFTLSATMLFLGRFNLKTEMGTTEHSEYTEAKQVREKFELIKQVNSSDSTFSSFSVYSGYSVVSHFPF